MKIIRSSRRTPGFTIMELTIAMLLAMGVAGAGLAILSQHTTFIGVMRNFQFLREDAPMINNLVARITGRAVSYRLYANKANAFGNTSAVNSGGSAVRLIFRNPNGDIDQSALVFENVSGEPQLNYYHFDGGWPANPNWTVTSRASNVAFANDTGVLLITLTGPNNEEITYVGSTD